MVLKLYAIISSPSVRAVTLCLKALKLEVEWMDVDLLEKEHLLPDFLKINPQHTVPVLDDDGFIVVDSHVIMSYLVTKYGKGDDQLLYPKDPQLRATVDHRLHFDTGILSGRGANIVRALIFEGLMHIPKAQILALEESFSIVEKFLECTDYVAGDRLTIADFSLVSSITSWSAFLPIQAVRFPKISAWLHKLQSLPYYAEGNQRGLDVFLDYIKDKLPNGHKNHY
ncbi:unnamed protein product [Phyllotreta striolata]|uniref:Uncharacterized protein n=1 Tax=Phyllotreta striolata TaxID=444603 RepID=A0A9N9TH79_PHYSR|nr:unnamed protein product [Phyllotreta striolata]